MRKTAACALAVLLPLLGACSLGDKEPGKGGSTAPTAGTSATAGSEGGGSDSGAVTSVPITPTTNMSTWQGKIELHSRPAPAPENWARTLEIQGDKFVINETGWEGPDKPKNVSKTITADKKKLDILNQTMNQLRTLPTKAENIGGEGAIVELKNGSQKMNVQASQGMDSYNLIGQLYETLTKE